MQRLPLIPTRGRRQVEYAIVYERWAAIGVILDELKASVDL